MNNPPIKLIRECFDYCEETQCDTTTVFNLEISAKNLDNARALLDELEAGKGGE